MTTSPIAALHRIHVQARIRSRQNNSGRYSQISAVIIHSHENVGFCIMRAVLEIEREFNPTEGRRHPDDDEDRFAAVGDQKGERQQNPTDAQFHPVIGLCQQVILNYRA